MPHTTRGTPRLLAVAAVLVALVGAASCTKSPADRADSAVDVGETSTTVRSGVTALPSSSTTTTIVVAAPDTTAPDDGQTVEPTTSTVPGPVASTTSVPRPPVSEDLPPATPGLKTAVYWTRPADGSRVDLPGYQDPASGRVPYLAFGSVENTGAATVAAPAVTAVWRDAAGAGVLVLPGRVIGPTGTTVTSLAPGATADVIVVVDPVDGVGLESLSLELVGTAP